MCKVTLKSSVYMRVWNFSSQFTSLRTLKPCKTRATPASLHARTELRVIRGDMYPQVLDRGVTISFVPPSINLN